MASGYDGGTFSLIERVCSFRFLAMWQPAAQTFCGGFEAIAAAWADLMAVIKIWQVLLHCPKQVHDHSAGKRLTVAPMPESCNWGIIRQDSRFHLRTGRPRIRDELLPLLTGMVDYLGRIFFGITTPRLRRTESQIRAVRRE